MSPRFTRQSKIFRDREVLSNSYQPNEIRERDKMLEDYELYLQPIIEGAKPLNIFLYGKTGVGKTAMTRNILRDLKRDAEEYDDLNITTLYLNCENYSTSYRVTIELVNRLREGTDRDPIPTTGHSKPTVFSWLWDEFEHLGGTIIVILDEVDNIGSKDSLLYQIPRAQQNGYLEDAQAGIIGISNDLTFRENLDPRAKDTLCEREIHFPPYDAQALENILSTRAEQAFHPDAIERGAVVLCAALASRDTGSARQGLDLLQETGYQATRMEDETVTQKHVRAASEKLEHRQLEQSIASLTTQEHFALSSVADMAISDPDIGAVPRGELYQRYTTLIKKTSVSDVTNRRFHDILRSLVMRGVLKNTTVSQGETGGTYYEYALNVSLEAALDALEESPKDFLNHAGRKEMAVKKSLIDIDDDNEGGDTT